MNVFKDFKAISLGHYVNPAVTEKNTFKQLNNNTMTQFQITYTGNATRFKGATATIEAYTAREAVEQFYQSILDENYFPQEDGSIHDNRGNVIAEADEDSIEYDGGYFVATLIY